MNTTTDRGVNTTDTPTTDRGVNTTDTPVSSPKILRQLNAFKILKLELEPFQFEIGHFKSCAREGQARESISAAAAANGELDDLKAICHGCNQWHEAINRAADPFAESEFRRDIGN